MTRLTISLNDERHRALKEAAARQGKTIGQIIDESLELYGIKTRERAQEIVSKARQAANLTEEAALKLAVDITREVRTERLRAAKP